MQYLNLFVKTFMIWQVISYSCATFASEKSQKVIDFDDDVVEGVNRKPLDSLNQISEADKRKTKSHLYRKRASFKNEVQETLKMMRYLP